MEKTKQNMGKEDKIAIYASKRSEFNEYFKLPVLYGIYLEFLKFGDKSSISSLFISKKWNKLFYWLGKLAYIIKIRFYFEFPDKENKDFFIVWIKKSDFIKLMNESKLILNIIKDEEI